MFHEVDIQGNVLPSQIEMDDRSPLLKRIKILNKEYRSKIHRTTSGASQPLGVIRALYPRSGVPYVYDGENAGASHVTCFLAIGDLLRPRGKLGLSTRYKRILLIGAL